MTKVISCCLIVAIFSTFTHSQTKRMLRNDLNVQVQISVVGSPDTSLRYTYGFYNSLLSHQMMQKAIIDYADKSQKHGGSVKNIVPPREKDWGDFPTLGRTMRWIEEYDTTGKDVLERPPMSSVGPGEHISFSFECKGLPTIGHFWAAGWAPWYFTQEAEDSLLQEGYPEYDLHPTDSLYFTGLTVVPRLPATTFDVFAMIDTLRSYTRQSADLGWLGRSRDDDWDNDEHPQDGIEKNIERRLTMAKRDLQSGDSVRARKDLQMLVNKVDRIWKRSQEQEKREGKGRGEEAGRGKDRGTDDNVIMTSEAYALLKYNTEYLIERLPARERREGKPERGEKK